MISIARYKPEDREKWNDFVKSSKNGTFLFLREYMDYHSDRFTDFSLVATKNGKTVALLPANISGNTLYSHQGLTYGGWITSERNFTATDMLELWTEMNKYLSANGVKHLKYKAIPHIYHKLPAEEDLYALFRNNAQIDSVLISSTVSMQNRLPFDQNSKRGMKTAESAGVKIKLTDDYSSYWSILSDLLQEKYAATPVHSLEEIVKLRNLFPDNIKLVAAYLGSEMLGGTVLYITDTTVHAQYICTTSKGRELKVLPAVFDYIITQMCKDKKYFDLGTSNEEAGRYLNEGLLRQKCGFGGRAIVYTTYTVEIP